MSFYCLAVSRGERHGPDYRTWLLRQLACKQWSEAREAYTWDCTDCSGAPAYARMEAGASEDCLPPAPMYGTCLLRLDRMKCDLIAIVHRLGQS